MAGEIFKIDYLIAVTGASGSLYAHRLIEELLSREFKLGLIFSSAGQQVFAYELNHSPTANWSGFIQDLYQTQNIKTYGIQELFAPTASGSGIAQAMVVVPASMGSIARIAQGNSSNLIERAADVYLKENRPLLLVPRETPLSAIHLENMLKLGRLGVRIIAAMPGFYHQPRSLDDLVNFMVGKILENLNLAHSLYPAWQGSV